MKLCYMSTTPEVRGPMPLAWLIELTQEPVRLPAARVAIDFIRPLIAT